MHSRFRTKGVLLAALLALVASMALPHSASAEPEPGAKRKGFRLFARALGAMTINRVYCGMATTGEICVDSTNSSTIGGGFWPKGTPDQYIFNSGLQVAGIVGPEFPTWAGDTVGGFFFDPKGTTQHGEEVEPIYNASNPSDLANWPEAACVPHNDLNPSDPAAALFNPLLQVDSTNKSANYSYPCRKTASQGDVWFVSWEGNPALRAGRKHPIGVMVETRGMGWNFPAGNEDILYFIYTFYNVTSTVQADYASYRPSLRTILMQKAQDFHAAVAATGVNVPASGYSMTNLFAAFARDDDVGSAGANYSSVNLPFALGYTYDHGFSPALPGWKFDPSIFSAPFFPGVGFTGAKYLKSPTGAGEIQLFSNTVNGTPFAGAVNDPRDVTQLYRYLSGTLSPATGDQSCNTGIQSDTRVCFVNNTQSADMRFFQSSTPLNLAPGASGSIVVAYLFAAPVRIAGSVNNTDVKPGDPRRLTTPAQLAVGANLVDSMTGFKSWTDKNGDGKVQQGEFDVVSKSLLGKANTAQQVFDFKFLLPFAPSSPDFFLVPGDNQVTVLWKPSASEASGDPFFDIATQAKVPDPVTGLPANNSLYDPNYRKFDVEGYRIYRGRVDAPNELALLAQFDYTGTVISDYTGIVNPTNNCAPELAITSSGCTTLKPNLKDGTALTAHRDFDLVGEIVQTNAGSGRVALLSGLAQILSADTAVNGGGLNGVCGPRSACPTLSNTGVPFVYVDRTPRNNFRYFYAVTAFDLNSIESGPTSLESPRNTKSVRPVKPASNYATSGQITSAELVGRGQVLNTDQPLPTIKQDGTFTGPFPPSNAWEIGLGAFVSEVLSQPGALSARLDSIALGAAYADIPHRYFFTATAGTETVQLSVPLEQPEETGVTTNAIQFRAVPVDNSLAGQFGGDAQYKLPGQITLHTPGPDYLTLYGRGCINEQDGFTEASGCDYNGSRWYSGTNETVGTPIACNALNDLSGTLATCWNTGGTLDGVTTISQNLCYNAAPGSGCRQMAGIVSGAARAGDFRVYWGAAGHVDSVIDLAHNLPVPGPETSVGGGTPYATKVSASWGILNSTAVTGTQPDGNALLTNRDFGCVEPFRTLRQGSFTCPAGNPAYTLSATAVPGPVGFFGGAAAAYPPTTAVAPAPGGGAGFSMYIIGDMFTFELTGGALPAAGTTWTLRRYVGAISGGSGGIAGDEGPYVYSNPEGYLPLTAIGAEMRASYTASNAVNAVNYADLKRVHTVPDPYYVTNSFEQSTDTKVIKFVNLPTNAIIRIYSSSGVLVSLLEQPGPNCQNVNLAGVANNPIGGECTWNVRNRNNQVVASGVYFYHIEANTGGGTARRVGRMTIVNFAQ